MLIDKLATRMTPARRRGFEYLDRDDIPEDIRARSHRDIVRSSALFGGHRALDRALRDLAHLLPEQPTVLDVGCGRGDAIPLIKRTLEQHGRTPQFIGLDFKVCLLRHARHFTTHCVAGSVTALPFGTGRIDLAVVSLLLHHFDGPELTQVLAELNRVARNVVIVDLRRSLLAAAGIWLASFPLGFHPYSRHDGVTSVMRGFTSAELSAEVLRSTGSSATIRRHAGFRLSALWRSPCDCDTVQDR